MENKFVEYARKINYYETDQMGIVHHSNYIRYFEEARLVMMKACDLDYKTMEDMGIIIPVTFAEAKYLVPLHFDDDIVIQSRMTRFDGIKMEVAYEIYKKGDTVLCTKGTTGHCFLDRELKPIRMKRRFPDLYERLKELVKE